MEARRVHVVDRLLYYVHTTLITVACPMSYGGESVRFVTRMLCTVLSQTRPTCSSTLSSLIKERKECFPPRGQTPA